MAALGLRIRLVQPSGRAFEGRVISPGLSFEQDSRIGENYHMSLLAVLQSHPTEKLGACHIEVTKLLRGKDIGSLHFRAIGVNINFSGRDHRVTAYVPAAQLEDFLDY